MYARKVILNIDNNHDIWYNYGINGIQGITVNGIKYVFRKNVFGDVTHIYKLNEGALELAAEYKYDAWGKCIVTEVDESGIGAINPIRYRGYYFDVETGLYYLNARYYDPETGRFISADETKFLDSNTVNGLNLYAYCVNNPVMNVDPSGTTAQDVLTIFERILTGIADLCRLLIKDTNFNLKKFVQLTGWSYRAADRWHRNAIAETSQIGTTLGKVATVISLVTLGIDIGISWFDNHKSGNPNWVSASVVDSVYIGARFALSVCITTLCSFIPVPVLGTAIGIGLSIAVDYLVTWAMETATDALSSIKSWAANVGRSINRAWKSFTTWISGLFSW